MEIITFIGLLILGILFLGKVLVSEKVMGTREVPDYQGIDQSKLVPLLVGAIQELKAEIELLKQQINKEEN
mgnify:CR=1 FL=1